jgi:hypothetical protein
MTKPNKKDYANGASGGAIYCLGFVGALVFYWQHANSFWMVVLGLLKALVWPAMLVYQLLQLTTR